jgi:hypothetical protein
MRLGLGVEIRKNFLEILFPPDTHACTRKFLREGKAGSIGAGHPKYNPASSVSSPGADVNMKGFAAKANLVELVGIELFIGVDKT